jgi:hypothetical protein
LLKRQYGRFEILATKLATKERNVTSFPRTVTIAQLALKQNMQHVFAVGPVAGAGSAQNQTSSATSNGAFAHRQFPLKGDKPIFNDWEVFAVDDQREKLYMYGGVRPGDESYTPTCDLHCLDLKTMQWWNLTVGSCDTPLFVMLNYFSGIS